MTCSLCKTAVLADSVWDPLAPVYVVAEISVNFNGSLDLAKELIEAAAQNGANAVKFQSFKAEEFVQNENLLYTYTEADGKKVTESQLDLFRRLELSEKWHPVLQNYTKQFGIEFFSSAADRSAVDLLTKLQVPVLKLASEDLINVALLEYISTAGHPVFLSTGMAAKDEIDIALSILQAEPTSKIALLHCVSCYPAPLDELNLREISSLHETYNLPVGFSDHSDGTEAAPIAVALGARLIEKHFTLSKSLPGPDHRFSADPSEFREMVSRIRDTEVMLGRGEIGFSPCEAKGRQDFRRSIVANDNLKEGTVLQENHLAYKRPGKGLKPYERGDVLGRKLKRDLQKDECIACSDLTD